MKNFFITLFTFLLLTTIVQAQSYNPFVNGPGITPAPLNDNGIGPSTLALLPAIMLH